MFPSSTNFGYLAILFPLLPLLADARLGTNRHRHVQLVQARDTNEAQKNSSMIGLAWPNADSVEISQYTEAGNVSWYYTWSASPTKSDIEFVPMFWGKKSVDKFSSFMEKTLADKETKVKALLGMNEPELSGQSNINAQEGVELWKTHIEPFHEQGLRLGSPAPSSSPTGKTWLKDFFSGCGDKCTVDFIALHWYGTNATQFISYVEDFHDTFKKPIWVTEWACQNFVDLDAQCSADDVVKFLSKTQTFMDNSDFVERYAWFGAMKEMQGVDEDNSLMDKNGKINSLGKQYVTSETKVTAVSASDSNARTIHILWAGSTFLMVLDFL